MQCQISSPSKAYGDKIYQFYYYLIIIVTLLNCPKFNQLKKHKKRHACYDKPSLCLIFGLLKYGATFEEYCDLNTSAIQPF